MIVFLDAGHGGKDPGAVGNGLKEKDRALDYVLAVGRELLRHGVEVGYTRGADKFVSLAERSRKSNLHNTDLFISFHLNSFSDTNAQGFEIYHFPNSVNGKELATNIHSEVVSQKLYTKDRGVKTGNFAVLRDTKAPATLIELGFISNFEDVNLLAHKQKEMVQAITKGILKTLNIKYIDKDVIDVDKPSDWAKAMWEDAIKKGYTDGSRPRDNITREEAMAMIYKTTGEKIG